MAAGDKTGGLLEWVVFTALIAIVGLAGTILPIFSLLAVVLMPLPVILLVLRLDVRYGILGLAASGFIMLFAGQEPAVAMVMIIRYGLLGIFLGLLYKNYVSSGKGLVAALLAAVVLTVISLTVMYALTGENPLLLRQEERHLLEQQWVAMNQQMQALEDALPGNQSLSDYLVNLFEFYIPGQIIVTSFISAAVTYLLARMVLERLKFRIPPIPAFSGMYLPWYSVWGLIIGLGLTLVGDQFSLSLIAQAGKNILFVLANMYLVLGLSVAAFYFRKINLSLPLKILFLFIVVSNLPFSLTVLLLLGAADPLINFRRLPDLK